MTEQQAGTVRVIVATEMGEFTIDINTTSAPITANNFLHYVDNHFYDGGRVHRTVTPDNQPNDTVRIEVIQAGVNPDKANQVLAPITLERTTVTHLRHTDGAISMGRFTPDSAASEFFICIGDQPELDFGGKRNPDGQGFAAFGQVVSGMDVVKQIQQSPAEGQKLTPPITITSIRRA
jgi:peptidyl-prolyl cis-trans isomerase A (cyclophilin A)